MEIRRLSSEAQKQSETDRKVKRNKYLGLGLLIIMVISSLGYAFISSDKTGNGSGTSGTGIYEQNGQWIVNQGQLQLVLNTGPDVARNVSSNLNYTLNDYGGGKVYVVDSDHALIAYLSQNVGKYVPVSEACYGPCSFDLPEKNCTGSDYVIVWNKTVSNSILQQDKCVFIGGDIASVDAFVYRSFGLI